MTFIMRESPTPGNNGARRGGCRRTTPAVTTAPRREASKWIYDIFPPTARATRRTRRETLAAFDLAPSGARPREPRPFSTNRVISYSSARVPSSAPLAGEPRRAWSRGWALSNVTLIGIAVVSIDTDGCSGRFPLWEFLVSREAVGF